MYTPCASSFENIFFCKRIVVNFSVFESSDFSKSGNTHASECTGGIEVFLFDWSNFQYNIFYLLKNKERKDHS